MIAILSQDLVIEAIGPSQGSSLVVSPEQHVGGRVEAFERKQVADGLNGVVATVDVVSEEDVAALLGN